MSKNKTRFLIIVAAVFVAFSVIAFAVPFVNNGMFWSAYIFSVIAIAAQIYAYPKAFAGESAKSKFYGFPIAKLSTMYLCAQLVLSLLFMAVAKWVPAWVGIVIFILMLCAAVIGFISADAMRDEVERQDAVIKKEVKKMRSIQSKMISLASTCKGTDAESAVTALAEELRYSDIVSSESTETLENELHTQAQSIEQAIVDGDFDSVNALCRKMSITLAERNRVCKLEK